VRTIDMGKRHLSDDRLIEVCLDETRFPTERDHLDSCPACAERSAHLTRLLTEVATVTTAEADAAFCDDRLAKQRTRILQRLEQEGRPGRVIAFPAGLSHGPSLRARPGMRWIAGAAAAGLLIGVLAGHLAHVVPGQWGVAPRMALQPEGPTLHAVSTTMTEEELLGMLEVALEGTGGTSLRPLDDLTPRVWEVAAQ
jgi:anti-sigma factor RsiW